MVEKLLIKACADPQRWYADKVGQCVPFLGESYGEFKSREDSGYINFVQYEDAERVTQTE